MENCISASGSKFVLRSQFAKQMRLLSISFKHQLTNVINAEVSIFVCSVFTKNKDFDTVIDGNLETLILGKKVKQKRGNS